jgi:hypothetical protein
MRIFISGHYTSGDVAQNVAKAIYYTNEIFKMGYYPYCPHLTHFWHLIYPHKWEKWIDLDLEWLSVCDGYFKIPGSEKSRGGKIEEEKAKNLGLKLFYSLDEILLDKSL